MASGKPLVRVVWKAG